MNTLIKFTAYSLVLILLSACGGTSVKRLDENEEVALTDKWNDTDSRLVADEMIKDMLDFPWYNRFKQDHGNTNPVIILQHVRNKSHEHIATDTFVNDIKRAVLKSGQADFVVSGEEREDLRTEKKDQELNASAETAKELGNELGADFALAGTINSMVDQLDGKRVTFYQVDLKLINIETNREAWSGGKKLKKLQEKSKFGF